MSIASQSVRPSDSSFESYVALANGLVADLTGICLLDSSLVPRGQHGELTGIPVAKWVRSLDWTESHDVQPAAGMRVGYRWWSAIPVQQSDGSLLGVFCVSQRLVESATQPSRVAADVALRLSPLLDCIHRELSTTVPARARLEVLTGRAAELEWLFNLTANLKGAVDEKRMLEQLVAQATLRLNSALGVLYVPEKRLTIKCEQGKAAAAPLLEVWTQTREHLITWVQRQRRPMVVNGGGRAGGHLGRCKVLCVPMERNGGQVSGALMFYNPTDAPNYSSRQIFLARHIGRQAASLVDAQFDLMTGLYTRGGLDQMYSDLPEDAGDGGESSVLYLDIDHVRVANELHGFELGNELIVRVAELLTAPFLPDGALAARISGDRFAVVLPGTIPGEALEIAHSLQEAASKFAIGPSMEGFDVSISCGVSSLVPMPDGLARAIAAAELACKAAKTRGRNRAELYVFEDSSMMRRHADMLAVGQLRSALKSDRLLLFAQRITPLQNPGLAGGYELLLRLRDTDGSLLSPGPLIDAARRYQLLPTVDRWVVKQALNMLGPYRAMLASRGLTFSVNVSGQSIGDETFIQHFTQLLKSANLPKACISVELTEQAAITNLPSAKNMVTRLGALGCGFALDDFGTGANSLTYLKALNVDRVKIDGSFVRDVLSDRNSQATVRAIVELARGLGIETVAEYVESDEIAAELRRLGVDYAQGYAFGKPEPFDSLLESLAADESKRLHKLFLET
jgi:diguanylate cyclase (GGDEF)-like protein